MRPFFKILYTPLLCILVGTSISLVGQSETPDATNVVEEVVVIGETIDINLATEDEVLLFYDAHKKGADLYKRKKYDEAKPYLLATARMGFKMSQARLANIYLQGLGSTERDSVKGIGWMGVAASPTTTPGIRNHFRRLLKQVPQNQLDMVQSIVDDYVTNYGTDATGTKCSMVRGTSHLSKISCDVKNLYKFRDVLWFEEMYNTILASGASASPF